MAKRKRSAAGRRPSRRAVQVSGRQPQFEALSVFIDVSPTKDARAVVRDLAKRVGIGRAQVAPVTNDGSEWEIDPRGRVTPGRAWDLATALRAQPEVVHAEPMFCYLVPENLNQPAPRAGGGAGAHDPATDHEFDWSLRKANVLSAWPLFGARPPGAGSRVGHPDTGYTPHPELADPARLLVAEGYDFDDDDANPLDDLNADFLDNPSHGTGTGSVILSGIGPALAGTGLILITSSGPFGDRARFKDAGFAAVLTKPVKSSALLRALTDVCFAARPPDAIAACGAAAEASAAAQIGGAKHRVLLA